MRRAAVMLGAAGLVATAAWFNVSLPASAQQPRRAVAPKGPLNTLADVRGRLSVAGDGRRRPRYEPEWSSRCC